MYFFCHKIGTCSYTLLRGENLDKAQEFINIFPDKMKEFWKEISKEADYIEEVRIRINNPITISIRGKEYFLDPMGHKTMNIKEARLVTGEEIDSILNHICKCSVYAFRDELKEGYITVPGGHRVGLAGEVVVDENGQIVTIKYVTFMNIRISHQILGVADGVIQFLFDDGKLKNSLIISPPGCGKTTMLRDVVRQLSKGNYKRSAYKVGVVDERNEIAGGFKGAPQNDLGPRTDVLSCLSKKQAMLMLIRSMSPEVLALDEIGGKEDIEAIKYAIKCGVKIVATIHAGSREELLNKPYMETLLNEGGFEKLIFMERENGICRACKKMGIGELYD